MFRFFRNDVGFFRKLKVVLGNLIGLWYFAPDFHQVPFFRQKDKKGRWYQLKTGTKCYLAISNVFLELQDQRWFALGNSADARQLNTGVSEAIKESESFDLDSFLSEIKKSESLREADILEKELLSAGVSKETLENLIKESQKNIS